MSNRPVKIRGHHLLCMLTYVGKGYSDSFVSNFNRITKRLNDGSLIHVVGGRDDICAGWDAPGCLKGNKKLCTEANTRFRDDTALYVINEYIFHDNPLIIGSLFSPSPALVHRMRVNFTRGTIRAACGGCEWQRLCTEITEKKYSGVKLLPEKRLVHPVGDVPAQRTTSIPGLPFPS